MKMKRGDVVFLRFPYSDGSGSKVRPAVVVQSDRDNQRLESTIVVSITGNTRLVGKEPGHILIVVSVPEGKATGLRFTSAVNTHGLFTIHTNLIEEHVGELSSRLMTLVDAELRSSIGL